VPVEEPSTASIAALTEQLAGGPSRSRSGHQRREYYDVGLIRNVKPYFWKIVLAGCDRMKVM